MFSSSYLSRELTKRMPSLYVFDVYQRIWLTLLLFSMARMLGAERVPELEMEWRKVT